MTISANAHERGERGGLGGSSPRDKHSADTGSAARAPREAALPSPWRIGLARTGIEMKAFFREKQSVVFVFTMPAIMLLLLGSIFRNEAAGHGLSVGALFAAGLIGGGVMSTSFQYLGISIAIERDRDLLKRLRGTPMPGSAYFIGKTGLVLVSTVAETLILVAVGMAVDHLRLPTSADRWWTLIWVFTLGTVACSLLGIAASSIPRSARSATAAITLPFVVLQFISGVRRHLRLAAETARENLSEARTLVAALAPAQLEGGQLDDALHRLAGQAAEQSGTVADFAVGGAPRPLPTATEVVLLRVCQEALANVRKHANAHRAWVRLCYSPSAVRLEVRDDGAGFDPAATNGGYGLRGMRARVDEAGGNLTVRSAPGAGTSVNVEVPA